MAKIFEGINNLNDHVGGLPNSIGAVNANTTHRTFPEPLLLTEVSLKKTFTKEEVAVAAAKAVHDFLLAGRVLIFATVSFSRLHFEVRGVDPQSK